MTKIAIVGSGNVGRLYGRAWVERGHQVGFSFVRDQARLAAFVAELGADATSGTVSSVVGAADVVVFCPPYELIEDAACQLGELTQRAAGKVLVDTTNPFNPERTGLVDLHGATSAGQVAELFPAARVVKAFHNLAVDQVRDARAEGKAAVAFIAGDSDDAKDQVAALAVDAGLAPCDTGGLDSARLSEAPGSLFMTVHTTSTARSAVPRS